MKKLLLLSLAMVSLSGCSELQVTGRAAVKELQAEAINVEWSGYNQQEELAEMKNRKMMAQAATMQAFEQQRARQGNQQKGLWERH